MAKVNAKKQTGIGIKILIVALCFQLPMAVLAYFVVDAISYHDRFATSEQRGNYYQAPLMDLLVNIGDHERLVKHCPAGTDCVAALAALEANIAKNFEALDSMDRQHGTALEFTGPGLAKRNRQMATRDNLEVVWKDITSLLSGSQNSVTSEINDKYAEARGIISTMITHLGDTSQLILDPDLDTYYTMDITLLALPQTLNRIPGMVEYYRNAASDGAFTLEEQTRMAANAALLQTSDIDRIAADTQTAMNENDNKFHDPVDSFQKAMATYSATYVKAATRLADLTRDLSVESTPTTSIDAYTAVAVAAQEQALKFWHVAASENNNLLDLRKNYYAKQRDVSLLLSALSLLVASLVAFFTARSMTVPLNTLSLKLAPGATLLAGTIKQIKDASSKGGDNSQMIGIICEELSAHADDMRQTASDLEVLVFGREMNR